MFRARLGQIAKNPPLALHEWLLGFLCILVVAYLLHEKFVRSGVRLAVERLRSGDEDGRAGACQALGQARCEEAQAAIPDLVRAGKDLSPIVRREAIDAIMRIGLRSEVVFSSLAAALEDEDDVVRTRAALAVGMLGGGASSLAAELIDALADRSPEVRAAAAVAVGLVAPRDERAVTALVNALGDEDERVRVAAGSTLTIVVPSLPPLAGDLLVSGPDEISARPRRQVARDGRLQVDARLDPDITAR